MSGPADKSENRAVTSGVTADRGKNSSATLACFQRTEEMDWRHKGEDLESGGPRVLSRASLYRRAKNEEPQVECPSCNVCFRIEGKASMLEY